jgi:hypothetical protein
MILRIYDITGVMATDSESGQKFHDLILPCLKAGKPVELDFSGVEIFATQFFNFAIGQLLSDIKLEQLQSLLNIQGLSADGQSIMDRAIEYAAKYYSDEKYRKAVDQAFEEEYAASF